MRTLLAVCFVLVLLPSATQAQVPPDLPALVSKLGSQVAWEVRDPQALREGRNAKETMQSRREHRDFDRVAALDAALERAAKEKRMVLWYAPRLLFSKSGMPGRQMYRPAVPDHYARAVLFSDPDIVDLLNRRFVPVRLICDVKLGKRFDISAPELVEPAVFFLSPDGKILRRVDRLRSFNAHWFQRLLLHELAQHPGLAPPSPELAKLQAIEQDRFIAFLDLIRAERRDGLAIDDHVKQVLPRLKKTEQVEALIELAHSRRMHDRLDGALDALQGAARLLEKDPKSPHLARIACDRGRILLLERKIDEATQAFASVRQGPVKAEAWYHLGLCDFFESNEDFALRRWKEVVAAGPDTPWAWKAAANLVDGNDRTPLGPTFHGYEDPFRTSAPVADVTSTAWPRSPREAEQLAREGVDFLLRMQRDDGGWSDSRYAYWPSPAQTPNVWVVATAVSCTALLEWRDLDPQRIAVALARGERYMLNERHMNRGYQEEVYADAYKLFYLARKYDLTRSRDERRQTVEQMNRIVGELLQDQGTEGRGKGFWGHEYPNAFTTAAIMNALKLVRERGARVPRTVMERGAQAMLTIRDENGAYAYGAGRKPGGPPEQRLKDSMGRSPICEAALIWAGTEGASPQRVATALDNFWKYLPRLERVRACDFHTDGELAGFFFWHAVFHTTESIKALPRKQQKVHQKRMLEYLTTIGELDGSFIDSHEIGKSYGTAMGLMSLRSVLHPRKP